MPVYHIGTHIPIVHTMTEDRAESHLHSLELSLYLFCPEEHSMLDFPAVEETIGRCLAPYKDRLLNELPEFRDGASIEQIGEVFFPRLSQAVAAYGLRLDRLEIGETPLRTYIIRRADGEEANTTGKGT